MWRAILQFLEEKLNPLHPEDPDYVGLTDVTANVRAGGGMFSLLGAAAKRRILSLHCEQLMASVGKLSERAPLDAAVQECAQEIRGLLSQADELLSISPEDSSERAQLLSQAERVLQTARRQYRELRRSLST